MLRFLKGTAGALTPSEVSSVDPLPVSSSVLSRVVAAADHATAAAATLVSVALASGTELSGISWSYSAAPTGGRLRLLEGATVVFDIDITAAGPGYIPFHRPKRLAAAGTIELAAAGAGVIGKVNVL